MKQGKFAQLVKERGAIGVKMQNRPTKEVKFAVYEDDLAKFGMSAFTFVVPVKVVKGKK